MEGAVQVPSQYSLGRPGLRLGGKQVEQIRRYVSWFAEEPQFRPWVGEGECRWIGGGWCRFSRERLDGGVVGLEVREEGELR